MKKLIIGIVFLSVIVIGVTANLIYQRSVLSEMTDILSSLSDAPSPENAKLSDELSAVWEKHGKIFSYTTHVEEVDNVECALLKLSVLAEDGDAHLYRIALGEVQISLDAIKNGDDFSFLGIF